MLQQESASILEGWSASSQDAMKSKGEVRETQHAARPRVSADGQWRYRCETGDDGEEYAVVTGALDVGEELVLPASVDGLSVREVAPSAFARERAVRCAVLPASLSRLGENAFDVRTLQQVEVEDGNPHLSSDGVALFDAAGQELLFALIAVESYTVPASCCKIAPRAFKGMGSLSELSLPASLVSIGSSSFFRTGLTRLSLPASLREIGDKAFSLCARLEEVDFPEGLVSIGAQAFSKSPLHAVLLPASLERVGRGAFEQTKLDFDDASSFAIAQGNEALAVFDGALYERRADGLHLVEQLVARETCTVAAGTVEVGESAFEGRRKLREAVFPEGLLRIGRRAFYRCEGLSVAELPDSLVSIGDEAFSGTALSHVRIGSALVDLGSCALETVKDAWGAGRQTGSRSLTELEVSERNARFSYESGLLVERDGQSVRTRLLCGTPDAVRIPPDVTEIAEMTFSHARIKELFVPASVEKVGQKAFLGIDGLERLHLSFPHEVDGAREVTLVCPGTARDAWDFSRAFCIDDDGLFFDFSAYDGMAVFELDPSRVIQMALGRLEHPVKLSESARVNYESTLARLLPEEVQRREDEGALDEACALLDQVATLRQDGVFEGCLDVLVQALDALGEKNVQIGTA